MRGAPDNLVVILLRRMDGKIDRIGDDLRDIDLRLAALQSQVANIAATAANHYASLAMRLDRLIDRVERLDIAEPVA